jgi:hypothetical protein
MSRSRRFILLAPSIVVLLLATRPGSCRAQLPASNTTPQDSTGYGAGGHRDQDPQMTAGMLRGRVYDEQGTMRQVQTDTYSLTDPKHKTETDLLYFDPKGHFNLSVDYKYDLHGALTSTDFIHFGLHGERTWEEITDYRSDGYEIKDWNLNTHSWSTDFNPYKFPKAPAGNTPPPISPLPTTVNVGVLFPRDYHPGDNIIGSLHLASYADGFKVVPGFSEFDFPIQVSHLPDGSPSWSSLEIGVKGDGYFPVDANGLFSLHLPMNWKGPLQLQALQLDPLPGVGPGSAIIDLGNPVAAPTLPSYSYLPKIQSQMDYFTAAYLVDLWDEAYDREQELDDAYDDPTYSDEEIANLEDDLDDCYDEIDHLISLLPPKVVADLANGLAQDALDYSSWLSQQPNLTVADRDDFDDANDWASFLHDEARYASFAGVWGSQPTEQPFWTNPILTQGKLGAIRGTFDDPLSLHLGIDGKPLFPIAATPTELYYLPPAALTPGLHNYTIDTPAYGETTLPVFYMTLTMWADQLNLHKGQSTTYHVKLDGTNGLPGGAWSSPFYPTDLVVPPSGSGSSSRTGSITLEVTNQSPATISMQNQFRTLDASNFVPSGSFQLDGGVHALKDGDFSIYGEARAYLAPELGLGMASSAPPPTDGPAGSLDMPSLNFSYDPSWAKNSPLLTLCSPGSLTGALPCMDKEAQKIYDRAIGNPPSMELQDHPDPAQLPEAEKRVEAAKQRRDDAEKKFLQAMGAEAQAFNQAASTAPPENQEEYKQATGKLRQAERAREKTKEQYDKTPNDTTSALALASADKDISDITRVQQAARQRLIDKFKPEDRTRWKDAMTAVSNASAQREQAEREYRAAREALNTLIPAAGTK